MADWDPKKCNIVSFSFYVADASAQSQSATAMSAAGEATAGDLPQIPVPWDGSIVGLSVQVEAARTAGTLTIRPTINGTATAESITIDDDPTQYNTITWRRGLYSITAGQRVGCTWASDASWAAGTTPSVHALVFVQIEEVN